MKETRGDVEHPPFNFAVRPDLGGTTISFVKEISRDRVMYQITNEYSHVKLVIPGHEDFLHIYAENLDGHRFIEAFYNHWGALTSANLWFRRYCDQDNFMEKAHPSLNLLTTYDQLSKSKTDILFEADMDQKNLGLYCCMDDSRSDNVNTISGTDHDMTPGLSLLRFVPEEDFLIEPVTFCANLEDNVLSLGFQPTEGTVARDHISTITRPDILYGKPTPKDIQNFIDSVFLNS